MKGNILKSLFLVFCCTATAISCSSKTGPDTAKDTYPLTAFAVKVGDSWYHSNIDHENNLVPISLLASGMGITDVNYTLCEGAEITPDPKTFIGNWQETQTVEVTSNGEKTVYTVTFTDWVEADRYMIFKDEFDVDGIPDPEKWVLCEQGGSDWNDEMSESYDQAYVKDGVLVLVGEKIDGIHKAGGIQTKDKFDFTFGRVECCARITHYPNGAFPAIWMMPQKSYYQGWPNCGEIDIMEHIKQEGYIHQTLHTHYTYDLGYKTGSTARTKCNFWDWTVYAVEWTSESLTFYVNNVISFKYDNMHLSDEITKKQWPFTKDSAFYLILNMGLGDQGTWAGPVDDAKLPAVMEVDWIRVSGLEN